MAQGHDPFARSHAWTHFVPDVGLILKPNALRYKTNDEAFWTISRVNSLGFLDREPPSAERAADSCYASIIGDSFVSAPHVSIADKVQVQLENLAARRLPQLDIPTSAHGREGIG